MNLILEHLEEVIDTKKGNTFCPFVLFFFFSIFVMDIHPYSILYQQDLIIFSYFVYNMLSIEWNESETQFFLLHNINKVFAFKVYTQVWENEELLYK